MVGNVAEGTGHIVSDVDNFLRLKKIGKITSNSRYIFIRRRCDALSKGFIEVYKKHFFFASNSTLIYNMLLPILMAYPELTIDCGLSRIKTLTDAGKEYFYLNKNSWQISKGLGYEQWINYYKLRASTESYAPLLDGNWESRSLDKFLGSNFQKQKYALIHIKTRALNATSEITNIETYIPALEYLLEQGYTLVLIGREQAPQKFLNLGVKNYANSGIQSFRNDLCLIMKSSVCLISGSGMAWLPDVMNKPIVYLNSWHIFNPPYRGIYVPSLVKRNSGSCLKFLDQYKLYMDMEDHGDESFPYANYIPRNATADEVFEAVKESVNVGFENKTLPKSSHQLQFDEIAPALHAFSNARISNYFINKHSDLL